MSELIRNNAIRDTFNAVAEGYDCPALRFFDVSAQLHADAFRLSGHENVLDLATGTGAVALAMAHRLPNGHVTGVDLSPAMLNRAKAKANAHHLTNVRFLEADMQSLGESIAQFDAAVCGFGIFFVEDMVGQLRTISSLLKPGGALIISGFTEHAFQPLLDLFFERLRFYGRGEVAKGWQRIATEQQCIDLFQRSGFSNVHVSCADLGYHLRDAREWWDFIWYAGLRGLVSSLGEENLARFKEEHLAEIQALATHDGIWLAASVRYTRGIKDG